jgi:hypothetical protein
MKQRIICILIFLFAVLPYRIDAGGATLGQKYPYSILTNDYGILNEMDLNTHKDGTNPPPFLPKEGFGYIYWQCFPRDYLSINLEDLGYSSEDIGWNENYGDLKITVSNKTGTSHEYVMRRSWTVSGYEKRFDLWIKLMKGEKYVCLAGRFINRKDKVEHGKKHHIYSWVFEKLKTKKGCDSYFDDECY